MPKTHGARGTLALLLCLTGCRSDGGDPDERDAEAMAGLGRCTQEEPGSPARPGNAVFHVDRTRTTGAGADGRYAAVLSCVTPGPGGTALTILIPNLADSAPDTGPYRVRSPEEPLPSGARARTAWAEATLPARGGVSYQARGGEVVVEPGPAELLAGSYLLALERDTRAPAPGPDRLVLGGAFAAPRNRLPAGAALPRARR